MRRAFRQKYKQEERMTETKDIERCRLDGVRDGDWWSLSSGNSAESVLLPSSGGN